MQGTQAGQDCTYSRSEAKSLPGMDICVCTFRRTSIVDLLISLESQEKIRGCSVRVIVADNDETASARSMVHAQAAKMSLPVHYVHAPCRNISIARNACLDAAQNEWVLFIDDDEIASPRWIASYAAFIHQMNFDVCFGPVQALYPEGTPDWILRQDYHSTRPVYRNGRIETGYAGNVCIRRAALETLGLRFDESKGCSGGEDTDFFFRLFRAGGRFAVCEEALVYEPVSSERLSFDWLAMRQFRSGQSYAASSRMNDTILSKARLGMLAGMKAAYCHAQAAWRPGLVERNYWLLRGRLHLGVVAGALGSRQPDHH